MPRPRKCRRICSMPKTSSFAPSGQCCCYEEVVITLDEFETIRLIDYEGLQQGQCSVRMNIARTTVQSIYNVARAKIADCLVNGKHLRIEGGDYKICEESSCEKCCKLK